VCERDGIRDGSGRAMCKREEELSRKVRKRRKTGE